MSWVDVTKSACEQMFPADLVTFTEEILNGKLHFLCSAASLKKVRGKCALSESLNIKWKKEKLIKKVQKIGLFKY